MTSALEIKNLKFSYGNNPVVLDIPVLEVKSAERVFIYGPSGCGKTTLLGLIAGVLDPQEGSLRVLNEDMKEKSSHERDHLRGAQMGYIFQMFNLIPYLNVFQNIVLPLKLNQKRQARMKEDIEHSVGVLAKRLNIENLLKRRVTDLSVGQQQRVAAARALIGRPDLIIADEPTSSLDAQHRQAFLEILLEQAAQTKATVLFVSHDQSLAPFFDRTLHLPQINRAAEVSHD